MMQNWLVGRITIPSYPDPCRFGYPIGRFQDVPCFDRFIIGQIPGNGAACRCAQGLMTDSTSENLSPSALGRNLRLWQGRKTFGKTPPFLDQRQQDSLIPELPEW